MRKKAIKKAPKRAKRVVKKKRAIKVVRTRNAGNWTEAQYFQKIRASLRTGFRFWKPIMLALQKASRPYKGINKRQKIEYQCDVCKKWFPRTGVQVHHIVACGSLNTYNDIVPFIQRLTIENVDGFQVVCKPDHAKITQKEKEERKLNKK